MIALKIILKLMQYFSHIFQTSSTKTTLLFYEKYPKNKMKNYGNLCLENKRFTNVAIL